MNYNFTTKLLTLFLFLGFAAHAQDTESTMPTDRYGLGERQHEIRLDVFDAAFFSAIDLSYERVSDTDFGYGASLFLNFRDSDDGYYEKFAFTPFFRFYFLNREDYGAKGLFAEAFVKVASGEDYDNIFDLDDEDRDYFDAAIGLSIGQKWVNRRGFILEISLGGGRNIGLDEDSPEFTFRGGISLGYRF
ncbi:hypothetical protein KORDIASMS9_01584 [Kordia sp. SMS9]|uniref:DUF3575 domain-containing protein n=1 Tax=Kordia sp. SMS9 TaxID=2282170 RepID=UPI000E10E91B|nr:DUF3575 domain-containing protein [Kordia sp. SMS9]AXG69364.1 hypothetical protein KORDIASMS9_01584 [Kordia sp. SMS9]